MPGVHAPIALSSLALTVACNASVQLQASVPEPPETDEEAEGTAAHLVAMQAAAGRPMSMGSQFESGGKAWTVDADMFNGANRYVQALGGPNGYLRLEDPVRASRIHPVHCWGTPDAWLSLSFKDWAKAVGPEVSAPFIAQGFTNVVRVGDYKYGHRFVEVFENFQLIGYAIAVLERLELNDTETLLELILVQPRSYHREGYVRIWLVRASDVRALVNLAFTAAHAALAPNSTATTGKHCIDCKARHVCATFKQSVASIVDYSGTAELAPLDAQAMGAELRLLDAAKQRLEARRTGLAVAVEAELRKGQRVPGYELAPGRSRLTWLPGTTPDELATAMQALGVNIRKPLDVMTPTQAIDAGIAEAIVKMYADRPPAPLVVKPISTTDVTKAFAKG